MRPSLMEMSFTVEDLRFLTQFPSPLSMIITFHRWPFTFPVTVFSALKRTLLFVRSFLSWFLWAVPVLWLLESGEGIFRFDSCNVDCLTFFFHSYRIRHSDFANLVRLLQELNTKSGSENVFKNTMLSWDCVIQRKKWFKCLDTDYLSLKSFLLERFMHDLLFESQTPGIISDFLGLEEE